MSRLNASAVAFVPGVPRVANATPTQTSPPPSAEPIAASTVASPSSWDSEESDPSLSAPPPSTAAAPPQTTEATSAPSTSSAAAPQVESLPKPADSSPPPESVVAPSSITIPSPSSATDSSSSSPSEPSPSATSTATSTTTATSPAAASPTSSVSNSLTGVGGRLQSSMNFHNLKAHDEREHVNIVFIGHVDSGKSTISGQILLQTGQVDDRTIAKYEKEAKEKNRESWYLAYIMDTNEEERNKGKTVEVGRAHFTTAKKRYTILDAPGHKNYVPNMIGGASQADVGVLVISARKGEFEAGFDRGGQTREHAMLAKTLGIQKLIVLVNKMDEPGVKWGKARFDEIESKLSPFLKKCGFNMKSDVTYLPASGYTGMNIGIASSTTSPPICEWYKEGRSLFQILDDLLPMTRDEKAGLRLPIMAKYKDMGATFVLGKLETGTLVKDSKLLMMPSKQEVLCTGITVDETEVDVAKPGENVLIRLKGVDEDEIQDGFVLSYPDQPCKRSKYFEAQVAVLDLLDHKPLVTVGYSAVLHVHVLAVECIISHLVSGIDKKTGEPTPKVTYLKSNDFATVRIKVDQSIAVEEFKTCAPLGRFTIRDEGKTIAIGKITKIKEDA